MPYSAIRTDDVQMPGDSEGQNERIKLVIEVVKGEINLPSGKKLACHPRVIIGQPLDSMPMSV